MAKRMYNYCVRYRAFFPRTTDEVHVRAESKADAYIIAVYEVIPKIEGTIPYSAFVESVTYSDGRTHFFNTSEGNAY